TNIDGVRGLGPSASADQGLRVRYRDTLSAPAFSATLRTRLPQGFQVIDWTQDNADYFRAIRIEKTMMSLILLLIVAVAAFNIVAMLVMVVTDKRTDIAILRTFGAAPGRVMNIFITQGLVIGWLGVALGVVLGLALALHVDTIVPFLEHTFGFQILDSDVYYITTIPSEVHPGNIIVIAVAALALTALATVYPAIRAARTAPAEALRYEQPHERLRVVDRHPLPALDASARLRVVRGGHVGVRPDAGGRHPDRGAVGHERLRARTAQPHAGGDRTRHPERPVRLAHRLAGAAEPGAPPGARAGRGALRGEPGDVCQRHAHGRRQRARCAARGGAHRDRAGAAGRVGQPCRPHPRGLWRHPRQCARPRAQRAARRQCGTDRARGHGHPDRRGAAHAQLPRRGQVPLGHVRIRPRTCAGAHGGRGAAVSPRQRHHRAAPGLR